MLCKFPFRQGVAEYRCGRCMPCRIMRRTLWANRLMLEYQLHESASFITLTYSQEHYPKGGTLVPRDLQLFLKRVREYVSPLRLRFFAVGEYGDQTWRPHYHLIVFGRLSKELCEKAWPFGWVQFGTVTSGSCLYVTKYAIKRMTAPDDPRLRGRYPEFVRMSLKPGIGADAVPVIAEAVKSKGGAYVREHGDVPSMLRSDGKLRPLGRYLQRKLREACGYDAAQSVEARARWNVELQEQLQSSEARSMREQRRVSDALRAEWKGKFYNSSKGSL